MDSVMMIIRRERTEGCIMYDLSRWARSYSLHREKVENNMKRCEAAQSFFIEIYIARVSFYFWNFPWAT